MNTITTRRLARYSELRGLGYPIGPTTACIWHTQNRYDFRRCVIKVGRRAFVDLDLLDAWIASRNAQTLAEKAAEE